MAKKKKKKYQYDPWDAEQEFLPGGSAAKEMRERERDAQTRGHTSWGYEPEKHRYNTKADIEAFKPIESQTYKRYVASIGSDINKAGVRGVRSYLSKRDLTPKNYFDTARYFRALSGSDFTMKTKSQVNRDFKKDVDKRYSLKRIIDKASRLNAGNTKDLIRRSYNDINAVRELGIVNKDADSLLKDIEKYRKAYGNNKDIDTASNYVQQISQMIKQQAKGGSAVSNKALEQWNAPLVKSPYDRKAKSKQDIEREYALINEMNMREKFKDNPQFNGKVSDKDFKKLTKAKPSTPAEKEWLEQEIWNRGTDKQLRKKYSDTTAEMLQLQEERDRLSDAIDTSDNNMKSISGQMKSGIDKKAANKRIAEIDERLKDLNDFKEKYYQAVRVPENMAGISKQDSKKLADIVAKRDLYEDEEREYLKQELLNRDDAIETYKYIANKLAKEKGEEQENLTDMLVKKSDSDSTVKKIEKYQKEKIDTDEFKNYRALQLELAQKIAPELVDKIQTELFASKSAYNLSDADKQRAKDLNIDLGYTSADDIKKAFGKELSQYGDELANDIFEVAKRNAEQETAQLAQAQAQQYGEDNPLSSILFGAVNRNVGGVATFAKKLDNLGDLEPEDYNDKYAIMTRTGQAYQEGGTEAIDNKFLKSVYQAVNSGADMGLATLEAAPLIAIPGVGPKLATDAVAFIMSTEAGASSMIEGHDMGMSDREALTYGLESAFGEGIGEKLSIELILNQLGGKGKTLKNVISGLGKSFLAEGSEEIGTDLFNRVVDNYFNGKNSMYNLQIKEYQKQGLTKDQARDKVDSDFIKQLGEEFTVGGLAGLMFGGGVAAVSSGANALSEAKTTRDVGKIINDNLESGTLDEEDLDYMTEVGMNSNVPEINEKAAKIKSKIDNGESVSDMEIGSLSRDLIYANEGIELEDTDIETNEQTSQIAEIGAEYNLPKKAIKSMVDNYDGQTSPAKYATGFSELYTMGQDTQIDSLQDAINTVPSLRNTINEIGTQAAGVAFSQGNNPRVEDIVLPQTKPKGRVVADFDVTLEDNLYVDTLKRQAKLTGLDIVVTDDISKYTDQKNAQGAAFISGGKVVLDKDTANILGTADHEILGHFGKALAPKSYKELANIVGSIYREDLGIRGYDKFVKQLEKEHGVSNTDAQEEAIAYGLETLMLNPEVAKKSIMKIYDSSMTEAEKKTIVSKLLEFVKHIIDNLKERVKNANVRTNTESMLDEDLDANEIAEAKLKVYEEIRTSLESMTETQGETKEDTKYSLTQEQQNISEQYNQAVEDNDIEKAAELVKDYAASKGYTQKVYHGSKMFGFTQIDLQESDDGISFFATDDLELAQSYSGRKNVKTIKEYADTKDIDARKLSDKEIADIVTDNNEKCTIIKKGDLKTRQNILTKAINDYIKYEKENIPKFAEKVKGDEYHEQFNTAQKLENYFNEFTDLYKKWNSNKTEENLDKLYSYTVMNMQTSDNKAYTKSRGIRNIMDLVRDIDETCFYFEDKDGINNSYYLTKPQAQNLIDERNEPKGNYQFYSNTDNFLSFNAENEKWNRISPSVEFLDEYLQDTDILKAVIRADLESIYSNVDIEERTYYDDEQGLSVWEGASALPRTQTVEDWIDDYTNKDWTTRMLAALAHEVGYEGLKIENVVDNGMYGGYDYYEPSNVYIFFNPAEQVKSADPITYDDNGNVIPLEERFSKDHDDIRYSMANEGRNLSEVKSSLREEVADRDIERFKAIKEDLGNVLRITKGSKLDTQDTRKMALQLKKNWNVNYDTNVMVDELKTIGRLIETKGIQNTDTTDYIKAFVTDVLKSEAVVDDNTKDFIKYVRDHKIYLSKRDIEQITDWNDFKDSAFGSMRLTTSRNGNLTVDEFYEHIKDNYPEYYSTIFDEQYPDSSNLPQLLEWIKTAREGTNLLDMYGDEAIDFYVQDVIGAYTNAKVEDITNSRAKRNKLYKDVGEMVETIEGLNKTKDTANQNLVDQMRKLQSDINQKLDRQRENITNQYEQKMKDIESKLESEKSENVKRIKAIKEKQKIRERKQADSRRRTAQRQVIRRTRDRVKTTINKPTIHKYIPIPLFKSVKELFNSIDLGEQYTTARLNKMRDNAMIRFTGDRLTQELEKIDEKEFKFNDNLKAFRDTLEKYVKGQLKVGDDVVTPQGDADTYYKPILDMIDNTIEKVGNTSLMKMDLDQLKEVSKTLRAIEKATTERQRPQTIQLTDENGRTLENWDEITNLAMSQSKKLSTLTNNVLSWQMTGRNTMLAMGGFNPNSIMGQLANDIDQAYIVESKIKQDLNAIYDKVLNIKQGRTNLTMKSEVAQRYKDDDLVDVGFKDINGKPILLNHDSLIWEYLNLESDDNLTHAAIGGISFPDYKKLYGRKGITQVYSDKTRRTNNVNAQLEEVRQELQRAYENEDYDKVEELAKNRANILEGRKNELREIRRNIGKHLTEYDKQVVRAWKEIRDLSTDMLNEYWLKTYGFENFNEEAYWRIVTNPNFTKGSDYGNQKQEITNLSESGSTIARLEGAGNPIISGSALFAIDDYINNTAKLIAYSGLQRDLNAVMRYTDKDYNNLQQTIQDNAPKLAENFTTFQQALFGGGLHKEGSRFIQTARGLAARSTLSPNLRVALAQVPSFLGTYRYTDGQAVKNAWLPKNRVKQSVIDKYTPLMYARGAGGYSLETSDLKQDTNKFLRSLNKADRALGGWLYQIPNKMDSWTVRHTFGAYLDYARRNYPNLEEGTKEQIENGESPLYKKAAELFNEGTMRTQPMFNAFNKNVLQLSDSELKKTLTIFHTQPFQYFNLAMQDIMNYKYEVETNGKNSAKAKKARAKVFKSIASILSGTALFTLIKIGVDKSIRHKKDEVEPEDVAEQLVSSMANMFVLGSTLTDAIYSLFIKHNGQVFDFEIYGTQLINSLIDFAKATANTIEGKDVNYAYHITNILSNLGIPVANIEKDLGGIYRNIEDYVDNGMRDFSNEKSDTELLQEYISGDKSKDDLKTLGVEISDKTKFSNAVKKLYEDGEIDKDTAEKVMLDSGLYEGTSTRSAEQILEGKVELWNINKYKDEYLSTLTDKGAQTQASRQVIAKIAKQPYNNAFYSNPEHSHYKNYKSSHTKLLEYIKKWKKSEQ